MQAPVRRNLDNPSAAPRCSWMMLTMHFLESPKRQMRINLRSGNVGMAQQYLHAAQVCAVLHHVRSATVTQTVRTGG